MALTLHSSLRPGYRIDSRLGPVYETNEPAADDLTVICGIETGVAVGLNNLGVYYYIQIAGWSDQQVTAVADNLGLSAAAILRDRWVGQARCLVTPFFATSQPAPACISMPQPIESLPASKSRTITILVCALLIGSFIVSWLNRQHPQPLSGVLTAEITSLRVPADSRLLRTHVSAGDEVFSGETLLTLEKSEHVELIAQQAQLVQSLQRELRKAETQASLSLKWQDQKVLYQVPETKTRALQPLATPLSSVPEMPSSSIPMQTVSHREEAEPHNADVNSLLFISGISGITDLSPRTTQRKLLATEKANTEIVPPSPVDDLLRLEIQKVTDRLDRLEQMRHQLPDQVRLATGVETLRVRYQHANLKLIQMQELSRESAVLCPGYGIIGRVRYRAGERMAKGEVMLKILHTDRRYLMINAPVGDPAELKPGTGVRIIFAGHEECRGVVAGLPTLADKSDSNGRSTTSVRVEPAGGCWPDIPIGSRVTAILQ